jgi:hypothetical protein
MNRHVERFRNEAGRPETDPGRGVTRDSVAGSPESNSLPLTRPRMQNLFYLSVILYDEWRVGLGRKPGMC